jgi:transcription antitermination factor NusG
MHVQPLTPPSSEAAPTGRVLTVDRGQWFALKTASRHERTAARRLAAEGLEVFVPSCKRTRRWSDRVKTLDTALFPGYIFSRFPRQSFPVVRSTAGVLYVVPTGVEAVAIPDHEITSLRLAIESGLDLEPMRQIEPGTRVEVVRGPLTGTIGRMIKYQGRDCLVIAVDLLQKGVRAEVNVHDVEPVGF